MVFQYSSKTLPRPWILFMLVTHSFSSCPLLWVLVIVLFCYEILLSRTFLLSFQWLKKSGRVQVKKKSHQQILPLLAIKIKSFLRKVGKRNHLQWRLVKEQNSPLWWASSRNRILDHNFSIMICTDMHHYHCTEQIMLLQLTFSTSVLCSTTSQLRIFFGVAPDVTLLFVLLYILQLLYAVSLYCLCESTN